MSNMDLKKLVKDIQDQEFRLRGAEASGMMVRDERERMKNLLFNCKGEIMEALALADEADEQIKLLELQLDDSDRELTEITKELKELKAGAAAEPAVKPDGKKVAGKRKDAEPVDEVDG